MPEEDSGAGEMQSTRRSERVTRRRELWSHAKNRSIFPGERGVDVAVEARFEYSPLLIGEIHAPKCRKKKLPLGADRAFERRASLDARTHRGVGGSATPMCRKTNHTPIANGPLPLTVIPRAARRAGSHAAISPTAISSSVTIVNAIGSVGVTPNRNVCSTRVTPTAPAGPTTFMR